MGLQVKQLILVGLLAGIGTQTANAWVITSTGVINSAGGTYLDYLGLFGAAGGSLVDLPYSMTITTDPLLNTAYQNLTTSNINTVGGNMYSPGSGAPYSLVMTVNGVSFAQTELMPSLNYSYLINALSVTDTSTTLQDQAYQQVTSNCIITISPSCTNAYILAYSTEAAFVPALDFNQVLTASTELNSGSNAYFSYQIYNGLQTRFYGTVESLSINSATSVPEPGTLALMGVGLAGILLSRRRRTFRLPFWRSRT